jgi:Putative DNA-binding domain
VNPLYARLGIPADADTLAGIRRLVSEQFSETRHLDFKRQVHNTDDLADDLAALANVGGGVLIIGVGTDNADRADSLHEPALRTVEQQAVQAAREGIDEPLCIEPAMVQGDSDPAKGYLVIGIPPGDRAPHITVKRGRVLHRVGTHNKPMTRRELGAAFAAGGEQFAIEFGLARGHGSTGVMCELTDTIAGMRNTIEVTNTGLVPALNIIVESSISALLWATDKQVRQEESRLLNEDYVADPPYLPIRTLAPGSSVVLDCEREWGSPVQDVLKVTWGTPGGQVHRSEQSWSWRPMGTTRR